MRLTLNTVNAEFATRGYTARLERGDGYFYFHFGEAADWLDRTVPVRTLNSLTLKQWIGEFHRLKALNEQIRRTAKPVRAAGAGTPARRPSKRERGLTTRVDNLLAQRVQFGALRVVARGARPFAPGA